MLFQESTENYLKAILVLKQKKGEVRRIDLAEYMGYSKASITHAVTALMKKGFLKTDGCYLELTQEGLSVSRQVLERHDFFTRLLVKCGVEQKTAEQEACGMEHVLSEQSFEMLKQALEAV